MSEFNQIIQKDKWSVPLLDKDLRVIHLLCMYPGGGGRVGVIRLSHLCNVKSVQGGQILTNIINGWPLKWKFIKNWTLDQHDVTYTQIMSMYTLW